MTAGTTIETIKTGLRSTENYRLRMSVYGQFGLPVVRVIREDFFHYLVPESMLPIVRVKDLVPDFFQELLERDLLRIRLTSLLSIPS